MVNISVGHFNKKENAIVHDVTFEKGVRKEKIIFKNIQNIKQPKNCSRFNCLYYEHCWRERNGIIDIAQCIDRQDTICTILIAVIEVIIILACIIIGLIGISTPSLSIVPSIIIGIILTLGPILAILSAQMLEERVEELLLPVILEKYLLIKLTIHNRKQRGIEDTQKEPEEIKDEKILKAEKLVKKLNKVSEKYKFGENDEDVKKCVKILNEIIAKVRQKPSRYSKVDSLFRIYIPEFYKVLKYYLKLSKTHVEEKENEEILTKAVEEMLKLLNNKKEKILLDETLTKMQLEATTDALITKMKMDNYN